MSKVDKASETVASWILALLSGQTTRAEFSEEQWNAMIGWGDHIWARYKHKGAANAQPLELWGQAFKDLGMSAEFQANFQAGVEKGVWVKEPGHDTSYVYSHDIGQPGTTTGSSGNGGAGNGGNNPLANVPPPPTTTGGATSTISKADRIANLEAGYSNILSGLGLAMTPGLQNLIDTAKHHSWNTARFQQALYGQPEFHAAFPGIFAPDGTLKMSPAQYLANQQRFTDYASRFGINMNPKTQAYLFQNNVSPSEFADRAQAITQLRTNEAQFKAFNQVRKAQGLAPLTKGQQMQMVLGEGNQQWYKDWNRASATYAAEQAGIKIAKPQGGDVGIGRGLINKNAMLGLAPADLEQHYQNLAQNLRTLMPQSRIQGLGLNKKQLDILEFGGKGREHISAKVQQIIANEQARETGQGNAGLTQTALGTRKAGISEGF